jgi:hypothetical protein
MALDGDCQASLDEAMRRRETESAQDEARKTGQARVGWPLPLKAAYSKAFRRARREGFEEWVAGQVEDERSALERHRRLAAQAPCLFLLVEESGEYSSSQTDIAGTRLSEKDARSWRGTAETCSVWALWPEDSDDLLRLDFEAELLREIEGARAEVRPFLEERLALLRARLAQLEGVK